MPGYGLLPEGEGEGLLSWSAVDVSLRDSKNYWVVTVTSDARPHAVPIWGVWSEGYFVFGTEARSKKAKNLASNPNVVIHLESGDDVVILEGTAEPVVSRDEIIRLDRLYREKYQVQLIGHPVYRVDLRTAYAWQEADFPGTATRWEFAGRT